MNVNLTFINVHFHQQGNIICLDRSNHFINKTFTYSIPNGYNNEYSYLILTSMYVFTLLLITIQLGKVYKMSQSHRFRLISTSFPISKRR